MARTHIIGSRTGTRPLDKLRPSHIDAWKVELKDRGLAESSIRTAYTVLRAVLDTAVRDKAIAHNPSHTVRRPRVTANEAAYMTPDQVRLLLAAAEDSRYAPLFALLVNSGLRRGEALALHWSDIDLDAKLLRVRGTLARVDGELVVTETKTAKSRRVVPLSPTAEKVLREVRIRQRAERLMAGSMWPADPVRVHNRARRGLRSSQRATGAEDGSQARRAALHDRAAPTAALCCLGDVVRWRAAQGGLRSLRSRQRRDHRRHLWARQPRGFAGCTDSPQRRPLVKRGAQRWSGGEARRECKAHPPQSSIDTPIQAWQPQKNSLAATSPICTFAIHLDPNTVDYAA